MQRLEIEAGGRSGVTTVEALGLKTPKRENKVLRRVNELPILAGVSRPGGVDGRLKA